MHKIFLAIHRFVSANKLLTLLIAVVYLIIGVFLCTQLKFEEDITRLIPQGESVSTSAKVLKGLQFADKITVVIRKEGQGTTEDMAAMADAFLDSLNTLTPYIKSVQGSVDEQAFEETFEFVNQNLPLFLDSEDYKRIEVRLHTDSLAERVENNYKSLLSPTGFVSGKYLLRDPLGISFQALNKLQKLNAGSDFTLKSGYIFTKNEDRLLIFISPVFGGSETEKNTTFSERLYAVKSHMNTSFSGKSSIDFHGASLIAVANARQIKQDILTTTLVSISLLMVILMMYYRKFRIPLIVFIPTIFGVLFSICVLYFIKDTISAISLSIGAVLIGVTIDYALHILTHYKHNSDISVLYKDITRPLLMSSITTAVAFLCLLFVKSEALKDLGIFAATGVVASAIFSLIIIPHLYQSPDRGDRMPSLLDKLAAFPFEKSRILLLLSVLIIVISCFTYQKVAFNNDISQLNYVPKEIREVEKDLEGSTNLTSKSLYLVQYSSDPDSILNGNLPAILREMKNKRLILSYNSPGELILSKENQQEKLHEWNHFWDANKKAFVKTELIRIGRKFSFSEEAYTPFYQTLNRTYKTLEPTEYFGLESLSLEDFFGQNNDLHTVTTLLKLDESRRDEVVKFLDKLPQTLIIDRQQLNETYLGHLKDDFNRLVNYSFVAVLLILFVFFRKLELVFISAVPILLTGLVTAGIMGVFNIPLNIFSTIVCTLIFGHGVDFSIFMTSALQKEYTTGKDEAPVYRTSILLAVLTTVLAIGALIFAEHPALKSISAVSLVGVFAAVLITFIFYPILFRLFISARPDKGKPPLRFRTMFFSLLSFTYYGLGGFLFSILSTLGAFWPGRKEKLVLALRVFMSGYMRSVLDTNVILKRTCIINQTGEDFKKPAVLIANHTSFLDILLIGMLHPKTVFLVSDWVYNSPIFGKGVRFSGFYPVSQGLEGGVEHLREKIEEGYSIIVFPEGTRSTDNVVKRFHKGAFYLAEYFNLDIVPVLIHGGSDALPKGDFFIRPYRLIAKILDRIKPSDTTFGEGFREKTKTIGKLFKTEYAALRNELEGPDYFRDILLENYRYKDEFVEAEVRKGLKEKEAVFYKINKQIPAKARVLHVANDYGEGDLLLVLQQAGRKVYSWIEDEEKRVVAKNNFMAKNRQLYYPDVLPEQKDFDVLLVSSDVELTEKFLEGFPLVIKTREYDSL